MYGNVDVIRILMEYSDTLIENDEGKLASNVAKTDDIRDLIVGSKVTKTDDIRDLSVGSGVGSRIGSNFGSKCWIWKWF
jgi:hypothetical protein